MSLTFGNTTFRSDSLQARTAFPQLREVLEEASGGLLRSTVEDEGDEVVLSFHDADPAREMKVAIHIRSELQDAGIPYQSDTDIFIRVQEREQARRELAEITADLKARGYETVTEEEMRRLAKLLAIIIPNEADIKQVARSIGMSEADIEKIFGA